MSDNPVSASQDIELYAAQWIRSREFGELSEDAKRERDAWLEQSVLHRVAYLRLDEAWNRTERLAALRQSDRRDPPVRHRFPWTMFFHTVAAALIMALLSVAARVYFHETSEDVYTTPVGGREVLTLFDSSHVELNTDSVLRVGKYRRYAVLEKGEVFFQIKHNAHNPFVVTAAGQRITDLGTQFTVHDYAGKLEVSLLEGSARIDNIKSPSPAHATVLTAGDVAVATAGTLSVTRQPLQALTDTIGWRRGVVIFRHMALADAATEFNRYNRKKLVVDPRIANIAIDGTFATDNLETFARVARIALGLHVESLNDEIVISR